MATTRSFTNAFEMVDYTSELLVVPNQWSVLNDIGLFEEQGVAQNTVTFEEINKSLGLVVAVSKLSKFSKLGTKSNSVPPNLKLMIPLLLISHLKLRYK